MKWVKTNERRVAGNIYYSHVSSIFQLTEYQIHIAWPQLDRHAFRHHQQEDKKLSCCCDSRSYCVRRTGKLSNRFRLHVYERLVRMHDPIQRVEFMNARKLYLLKRDH